MGINIKRNPILVSMLKDIEGTLYRGIGTGVRRILRECENPQQIAEKKLKNIINRR